MASVPASYTANINFNVLQSGGNQVRMNGVFLTDNVALPEGQKQEFASSLDVALFFGSSSVEHEMAVSYFNGYSISTAKPGKLIFYRVGVAPTSATLTGGALALTLGQLQALDAPQFTITVDGVTLSSGIIDFSIATSFTNAAEIITAAFVYSGTPNFTVAWNASGNQFVFTSNTTGTGSTITDITSTFTVGTDLKLTTAAGATVASPGTNGTLAAGGAIMDAFLLLTRDWATFTTTFEPLLATKKQFAAWVNGYNAEYSYICYDSDTTLGAVNSVTDNMANYLQSGDFDNTALISKLSTLTASRLDLQAAFLSGSIASVDFNAVNGRPTFAFKQQGGLIPGVEDKTLAQNFVTNGVNFYIRESSKNTEFQFFFPGSVSGAFRWLDDLVNAIYMKAQMQNTLQTLQLSVLSIPYNLFGYQGLIATSLLSDIQSFVNFGAIRSGVVLSGVQIATLNASAGRDISQPLFNKGFVLDVLDPGATVRHDRGSPIINLYFTSGEAVHFINMTATLIQ